MKEDNTNYIFIQNSNYSNKNKGGIGSGLTRQNWSPNFGAKM